MTLLDEPPIDPPIEPEGLLLTVGGVDVSAFGIYSVDISAGRDDISSQPDGSSFQIEFVNWESAGRLGDEIVFQDEIGQMFRGWVTDIKADLQEDMAWRTTINGTGPLALLGQVFAGIAYYPVETDSLRIKRIVDETPLIDMLQIDTAAEGYDLAERQEVTAPANAAELARLAADSGMGVLWEQPASYDKPLRYTPAKYRTWDSYLLTWGEVEGVWSSVEESWDQMNSDTYPLVDAPPSLTLDPAVTFADLTFEQTLDDLVRTVKVTYGPDDVETEATEVMAGTGEAPSKSFTTILNEVDDATRYATTVLDRQSTPTWRLSSVRMDLEVMPFARQAEIRKALQVGTKITIIIPHGSPAGDIWEGFLEGWNLSIIGDGDGRSFTVDMSISDRFMTEPADRWMEVPDTVMWGGILDTIRWQDTTNIPDAMEIG